MRPEHHLRKHLRMADFISPETMSSTSDNNTRTHEQLRRKAHDRFISPATQEAISDAAYSVPGITVFDHQRILEQLAARLNDPEFLDAPHFRDFRTAAVAFAKRQAELTVKIKVLMPELSTVAANVPGCRNFGHVATMTYQRTPEFTGDVNDADALQAWTTKVVKLEAEAVVALAGWIEKHRKAVLAGIWEVLAGCLDLGIDGGAHGRNFLADELAAQVWRWAAYHADDLLNSPVPVHLRLREKAHWTARAWKTARLAEREVHEPLDALVDREYRTAVPAAEAVDLAAIWNPVRIESFIPKAPELHWTDADLDLELRRAGPFRADDVYGEPVELLPLAA